MVAKVAIIGVGYAGFRPVTPEVSYKELAYEAATKAYRDAGVDPRRDIQSFVGVSEDFNEGTSIFDEYVPDQIGAALKPVHTIGGDGIHGLITGYMLIATGLFDVVAIEAHSKASNILHLDEIVAYAMDPVLNRPLTVNPHFIAGLEMNRYLYETGTTREQCAAVIAKNKANALLNPAAAYPAAISVEAAARGEPLAEPLTDLDVAPHADGAVVMVLASAAKVEELGVVPVWIRGVGWANSAFNLESRDWATAEYARLAGQMAYRTAGIRNPLAELDFAEIDDTFSYKELQHLEALGLARPGEAGSMTEEGVTALDGTFPVNPSGGSLGVGHLLDASGLARVLECVLQLRGQAGERQLDEPQIALAFGWRGLPTASGAAVILEAE